MIKVQSSTLLEYGKEEMSQESSNDVYDRRLTFKPPPIQYPDTVYIIQRLPNELQSSS